MSSPPALFLRLNGEIRGPFEGNLLRELAGVGAITPETEASENAAGPWTTIDKTTDCADLFPERVNYQFKARLFERTNPAAMPPVDHGESIAAANRTTSAESAAHPPPSPGPPNDVEHILRLNLQREQQAGLHALKPMPPVPNRRRRDFWMLLIGGNLVLFLGLNAIGGLALGGVAAAVFTAWITWVMYGIMDRY